MLTGSERPSTRDAAPRRPSLRRFWRARAGTTAMEYAVIGAILSTAILAAMTSLGSDLGAVFDTTITALQEALP